MTERKGTSRRRFLEAAAIGGVVSQVGFVPRVHAAGSGTIKVGLVGCGGRGTGAAENICEAAGSDHDIKLHAMGDVFEDRLNGAYNHLKGNETTSSKFDVAEDRKFVGFDAFEKVIDACDLVILATPPGFRPQHLEYAVKKGRNIFTEKPVAVDGTGIRKVLAAYEEAKKKNLAVVTGTQRRHQAGYIQAMERIRGGDLGDIVSARVFWNQNNIWAHKRQSGWNDMEYQLRNWYHFTWLCGQCIVEQHVHNIDVARWALGDATPVSCVGMGGRSTNTEPEYGESFDHFAVDFEFPGGVHVHSMARQINGCASEVAEHIEGAKGRAHLSPGQYNFEGPGLGRLRVRDERNPYVQEHIDLLNCIRDGKPINELKQVAESTLMAIMGRMSAFTGKQVSWEQALNSGLDTFPKELKWGDMPPPVVAKPGVTELI
jgi:predicted dehydrogenase